MSPHDIVRVEVSPHACSRFVERRGASSDVRAEAELLRMSAEGKEVVPPSGWALSEEHDRRHDPKGENRYIRAGGWLLVLKDTELTLVVVTAYQPGPETWWW